MHFSRKLSPLTLVTLALLSGSLHAQSTPRPTPLFVTIQSMDAKLFDAYNTCDLKALAQLVSPDLEFYHDQTGLEVGRDKFLAAIKQNICGKVERKLVPGSMEVYPLKEYGAVQLGVHRFYHPSNPADGVGEGKFIVLWQNRNGAWIVTRVISYEHHSASK